MNNIPPNSLEIEHGCLSCALLSSQAFLELKERVKEEDFYYEKNRVFYRCLLETPSTDWALIKQWYHENGFEISYQEFVEIFETSASSAQMTHYIDKLLELSKQRQIITAGMETMERGYKENPEELIADLENKLRNITLDKNSKISNSKEIFRKGIEQYKLNQGNIVWTGLRGYDELFYGIYKSEVTTIAARPSEGKSTLALNIANYVSAKNNVLFFSIEQPLFFQSIRLLSMESGIDSEYILHNKLDQLMKEKVIEASERLRERHLNIDDSPSLTGQQLDSRTRRFHDKFGLDLMIVDYVQILKNSSKQERYLRISEDMKIIKLLARDLNIAIIAVSQLGRQIETRTNKIPVLSDLKESGSLEDDSDRVVFIHNNDDECTLIQAKSRNGAKGNAPVTFDRTCYKFT